MDHRRRSLAAKIVRYLGWMCLDDLVVLYGRARDAAWFGERPQTLPTGLGYFRRPHADTIKGRLTIDVGVVRKTMASSRAGRSTSPVAII